ncbi:MAG: MFS transporter, partial [Gammaproteobacteria bacterium]|nr:MFS transporter [Gammaproteobacteria bacterium]
LLHARLRVDSHDQWIVYLPVLLVSIAVMVPAIIIAEKYRRMKAVFIAAVAALALSQLMLLAGKGDVYVVLAAITLFFAGFNVMEASLPSLITKTAPAEAKGTATGIYSSSQFLGIFVGGVAGGWIHQISGIDGVFAWSGAIALIWLAIAATMKPPSHLTTRLIRVAKDRAADSGALAARLRRVPGVADAVVIAEDGIAYLKIDSRSFDAAAAEAVAGDA